MPEKSKDKERKRMVVEEVTAPAKPAEKPLEVHVHMMEGAGEPKAPEITEEAVAAVSGEPEPEVKNEPEIESHPEAEMHPEPAEIPQEIPQASSNNPLWIIIPGIFLLGALLGGVIFYQKSLTGSSQNTQTPISTFAPGQATPSASPSDSIDLTKYPISVLNGSGIGGEAGSAKNLLTAAGFTVSGTGNAQTYDYTKTVIQAKTDVTDAFLTKLSDTLSKTYVLDKNQSLPDTSTDEVVVIIGSSKSQ